MEMGRELFFQAISKVLLISKEIKSDLLNLIFAKRSVASLRGVGANKNHLECARNVIDCGEFPLQTATNGRRD